MRRSKWALNAELLVLVLGLAALSLSAGVHWYAPSALWTSQPQVTSIMWQIRLPRVIAAAAVGALLAFAGQLMQGLSRNPIADPSILGVNAGATLMLMLGALNGLALTIINTLWLSLLGAGIAFMCVLALAMRRGGLDVLRFILGGTVFSSLITCLAYAVGLLTNSTAQFRNLLVGGFTGATASQALTASSGVIVVVIIALFAHKELSLMVLDDTTARSLGVDPSRVRLLAALLVVICAGIAVAIAGNIGFVGLGVPQVIAYLHPDRFEKNMAPTMLGGAAFMLAVDVLAKTVTAPNELPLSALSAICGGIFLFAILSDPRRQRL
ncbi:FecCD family ABC transporter permease [Lacticaseibacillus baoqingensis]|nr:iron ABC transporter permease [Lacticaseibacillus baoqingensis]